MSDRDADDLEWSHQQELESLRDDHAQEMDALETELEATRARIAELEARQIWIVTMGVPSDRSVVAVCDNRKLAVAAAKKLPEGRYDGPFTINDFAESIAQGLRVWFVVFEPDSEEVAQADDTNYLVWYPDNFRKPVRSVFSGRISVYVFARDREHAVKVATEQRAAFLANEPPAKEGE